MDLLLVLLLVAGAVEQVFADYPRLKGYILDDQGEVRKHVAANSLERAGAEAHRRQVRAESRSGGVAWGARKGTTKDTKDTMAAPRGGLSSRMLGSTPGRRWRWGSALVSFVSSVVRPGVGSRLDRAGGHHPVAPLT